MKMTLREVDWRIKQIIRSIDEEQRFELKLHGFKVKPPSPNLDSPKTDVKELPIEKQKKIDVMAQQFFQRKQRVNHASRKHN